MGYLQRTLLYCWDVYVTTVPGVWRLQYIDVESCFLLSLYILFVLLLFFVEMFSR
jgi:hypothetical protein